MKRYRDRQKTKIVIVLVMSLLLLSCFTTIIKHDIVFADTALNVITPVVLTALGLILPEIKKREVTKAK